LVEAIVTRKTVVSGETVVMIYNKAEVGLLKFYSVTDLSIWHVEFLLHDASIKCSLCCGVCLSICLSMCLSCLYMLSKRIKLSSIFFHHRVATPF